MPENLPEGRNLKIVHSRSEDLEKILSPMEFFRERVLPLFQEMSVLVSSSNVFDNCHALDVPERLVKRLRRIIMERSMAMPEFKNFEDRANWLQNKIIVRLVENYACYVLIARIGEDEMAVDEFALGKDYYFDADQFCEEVGAVDYAGNRYWEIQNMVRQEKGRNSQVSRELKRVVELIKALLYQLDKEEDEREVMASELSKLRMKIGSAAAAVVDDFIENYLEGDGWVDAVVVKDIGVMSVEKTRAYQEALMRLQVGRFDLNKLR